MPLLNDKTAPPSAHKLDVELGDTSLYREVFDAVGTGFCVIELVFEQEEAVDFVYLKVNKAFDTLTGLGDVTGRSAREVLQSFDPYWLQIFARVAHEGRGVQFERAVERDNRWYSVEAVPMGPQEHHRVAVLFFDITERKRIETELAESEARFSALADGLPMPVWVLDDLGHVRFVNSEFGAYFGVIPDEDRGPGLWRRLLHSEEWAPFEFELISALAEPRELHLNVRVRRHDGQWRWVEMNAVPRFSADGRFIGLAGNSPDITERREIELAREDLLSAERTARNTAESMARMKDEFLATLSHELRTPLTTVLGWSELLLQRMEPDHPMRKGLEVISSSAQTQKHLMSDMLDLSSMLLGKVQLEVEVLDLGEQIREVARALELLAEGKAQELTLELPEQPCRVLGDATRIRQILSNLLSNAIKFTPVEGRIEVQLRSDGDEHEVRVTDNGDGIAPEFLQQLFSRFSQADGTTTRRHGGLGLGLAIAQQLTELHGGNLRAESAGQGEGATFRLRLPAYQVQDSSQRPRRKVQRGGIGDQQLVAAHALAGLRTLVVEDQPDMLAYLRRLLEEQGASVVGAASAAEALELLGMGGHAAFDVLISDIGMPGMDGYGLINTLRETLEVRGNTLPAVAVTALAREDDRRRAIAAGFQSHIAKPYSVAQLVGAIREACRPPN